MIGAAAAGRSGQVSVRTVATCSGTPQPPRALSLLLVGALSEACFYIADADDPEGARQEVGRLVERLLAGLRTEARTVEPVAAEAVG